ncbi:cell division protein PerM [Rhodococcus chondri]|uniref:DUF6350 family protein n=1 Tax=Rhodococcus chondri TaxID=3065941 RepID=A0ABU7JRE0_9NOCA|nr:DUF6350 family protein [Rhodococcus sp. CC-R104]MEE2032582.1 DUF6350 family protein [Rhodococcus sp. CC-R104]
MTSTLGRSVRHSPSEDDHLDPERFRILVGTAARVPALTTAFVATVVVLTMVAANSDLTGIYAGIAGSWLALHQVTLTIDGTSLGVLPLLPTAVLVWLAARVCAGAADATIAHTERHLDTQDAARITAAVIAGPMIVTVIALVVMQDAATVLPVASPNPASALAWVTGLYLLAAVLGIGSRTWRPVCIRFGVPEWLVLSAVPAVRVVLGMFAFGGIVTVGGLLWSWDVAGELLARGDGVVGVLGLTLLSILYLPNLMLGASAVLAGSTVEFGELRLSLFEASGGDLPALPLLAAVPAGPAGAFWPVLLAVPATVGALLGRFAAQRTLQAQAYGVPVGNSDAALTVLAAAAQAGVVTALLTWVAGGPLGVFGVVGANWWLAGVLVFAWAGLLGLITAQLLMWREGRLAAVSLRAEAVEDAVEGGDADGDGNGDEATPADAEDAEAAEDTETADDTEDADEATEVEATEASPEADTDESDTDEPDTVDADDAEDESEGEVADKRADSAD